LKGCSILKDQVGNVRTLNAYNFLTLNGFFRGLEEKISWHKHGGEEVQYSLESLQSGETLLFGR